MPHSEKHFYNLMHLHWWFLTGCILLAGTTVWVVLRDHGRLWRECQAVDADAVRPWLARARQGQRAVEGSTNSPDELHPQQEPSVLRGPLVDAFNSPTQIEQVDLPGLPLRLGPAQAPRTDRCMTCHQGIGESGAPLPGNPRKGPNGEEMITLPLVRKPAARNAEGGQQPATLLREWLGLTLVERDMLRRSRPTVLAIAPESPAARAGLTVGDRIFQVGSAPAASIAEIAEVLETIESRAGQAGIAAPEGHATGPSMASMGQVGYPAEFAARRQVPAAVLRIQRGVEHPFGGHPRLELFVSPESPHPVDRFGCTICHDGQPAATAFFSAGHTPEAPHQAARWHGKYLHTPQQWPSPMLPARLLEARCVRCHYQVFDLADTYRRPAPEASRVVEGFRLVRELGCFGCHEITGYEGGVRTGPDIRLEPPHGEAAEALLAADDLPENVARLASRLRVRPADETTRRQLLDSLQRWMEAKQPQNPTERTELQRLASILEEKATEPGTERKVGPSLRHVAEKLNRDYLVRFVLEPQAVQPDARMPKLFGLTGHLSPETADKTTRHERLEARAVAEYLLAASSPSRQGQTADVSWEAVSAERGRALLETQGCLACHRHREFPELGNEVGPELSGLPEKLGTSRRAFDWLVAWLRDPASYTPRTRMPQTDLAYSPLAVPEAFADGAEPPENADPVADVAAFLLGLPDGERPDEPPPASSGTSEQPSVDGMLDALVSDYAAKRLTNDELADLFEKGLSEARAAELGSGWGALIGPPNESDKLHFLGYQTIAKRGCFGCHSVAGFEGAGPIGPPLSDFGRKAVGLLAFEQIDRYQEETSAGKEEVAIAKRAPHEATYLMLLRQRRREGFLWQKLQAPRSFDYELGEEKSFHELLRMGRFPLSPREREAVMAFVLGLTQDFPGATYSPYRQPQISALAKGRAAIETFSCDSCHTFRAEQWEFRYLPDMLYPPPPTEDYPFLEPHFPREVFDRSRELDLAGFGRAVVEGQPQTSPDGNLVEDLDEYDNPLYYFTLWRPAVIAGELWRVGGADPAISAPQVTRRLPPWGGQFARDAYPILLDRVQQVGGTLGRAEAWGLLPPPLIDEGAAVRRQWLEAYLENPGDIRPAALLPMPAYDPSPLELAALADYFLAANDRGSRATDDVTAPSESLSPDERNRRREAAYRLLRDETTYCGKCHVLGDRQPANQAQTVLAPRLDQVWDRLQPRYLRRWLANPKRVRPYTAMPVNFPYDGQPLDTRLFDTDSHTQLQATIDLLLHYPEFLQWKVQQQPESDEGNGGSGESSPDERR